MVGVYRIYPKKKKNIFSSLSVNTNLIIINVVLFVIFTILIYFEFASIDSIAIRPSNILGGNYLWTFLTSMFMHGGFFHLFVNMFSLFFVGSLLQKILGAKRYLYFYLVAGLFAGLFFVFLSFFTQSSDFNTYAVGASGAIFGLIGLLMFLTPNLPVYIMFIPIPIKMKYAAPGMLVVLWLISQTPRFFGGEEIPIGNTAHLGGFIAGVVYGIYLKSKYKNKVLRISRHFS